MNARFPYMQEFLKHFHMHNGAARDTIEGYEDDIRQFFNWMLTNYGFNDVTRITTETIQKFRDYMREQGYAIATVQRRFCAMSQFISYLILQEVIPQDKDPWPKRLNLKGKKPLPHIVPVPVEIFRIRMRNSVRLEHAWFFELALSSGMRSGEIAQLVPADFNFNDRPFDRELGRPSPYFVGSIWLKPTRTTTKNRAPRKVYFSYLAGILIKEFLGKHRLSPNDTTTCIFPWARTNPQDWMQTLGEGIVNRINPNSPSLGLAPNEPIRDRYYQGINPDALNVDARFKRLILKRQEEGKSIETYKLQAAQPLKARRLQLHPHSLRHSFTNFMYYRNPMGERQAESSLRILLGHQDYDTTFFYLRDLSLLHNDASWRQLWLGKPHDWNGINR